MNRKFIIKSLFILLILILTSCFPNAGSLKQGENGIISTGTTIREIPPLHGYVIFPESFNVKATESDLIKNGATVSLIQLETGRTVASGMTDASGQYVVLFNYKIPLQPSEILNKFLIVEAHKRQPDSAKGEPISLRTLVKFRSDYTWESITGTSMHAINSTTTAISIMHLKNRITDLNNILSKVQVNLSDPLSIITLNPIESLTVSEINNLKTTVENTLFLNKDPIFDLTKTHSISSMSNAVFAGQNITINGDGFGNDMNAVTVEFIFPDQSLKTAGNKESVIDTKIVVQVGTYPDVPQTTGVKVKVTINASSVTSNQTFTYIPF